MSNNLTKVLLNYNVARRKNASSNRSGHRNQYIALLNAINRELKKNPLSTATVATQVSMNANTAARAALNAQPQVF